MNYWPVESCNLGDCVEPLIRFVEQLSKNGKRAAQETYNLPGWVSHHNIDIWRAANPVGLGAGSPTWANWQMSGPWLCAHLYEHYRFTADREFLRARAYPLMKRLGGVLPRMARRGWPGSSDHLPIVGRRRMVFWRQMENAPRPAPVAQWTSR